MLVISPQTAEVVLATPLTLDATRNTMQCLHVKHEVLLVFELFKTERTRPDLQRQTRRGLTAIHKAMLYSLNWQ